MRVTVHQPEHLPWAGFFHKINMADTYVVLDNVQYRRRYFQNRNRIRTKDGEMYITVPLVRENRDDLLIKDARIFRDDDSWRQKNIKSVATAYSRTPYFEDYFNALKDIYMSDFELLAEMNLALIGFIFKALGMKTGIVRASSLGARGDKGDLILDICRRLEADTYISGISGKDYLGENKFRDAGIEITYQEFHHPVYEQLYRPFLPCMSVVDLLFNLGPKSYDAINGVGFPVMEGLFL